MRARCAGALAIWCAAACSQRTGVVLTVNAQGLIAEQIRFTAAFADSRESHTVPDVPAGTLGFPSDVFAEFDPRPVTVAFTVEALVAGAAVAAATPPLLAIEPNRIARVTVDLVAPQPAPVTQPTDGGAPHVAYAHVVLADAPLAYYRLDETSGAAALDASGHGLTGSYGARVTRGVPGLIAGDSDGAAAFGGGSWSRDGIVVVPPGLALEPQQSVSLELWLSQPVLNPDGAVLVDYADPGAGVPEDPTYGVWFLSSAFDVFLLTGDASGALFSASTHGAFGAAAQPGINRTTYFVETWDGQSVRVYIDGQLESSMPMGGALAYAPSHGGLGIGGTTLGVPGDLVFAGTLDEVAIYDRALSPQQVATHFAAGR